MIFVGTGKSLKKDLLILLYSTIRQLKDFKCTIIQLLTIYLESSLKFLDF